MADVLGSSGRRAAGGPGRRGLIVSVGAPRGSGALWQIADGPQAVWAIANTSTGRHSVWQLSPAHVCSRITSFKEAINTADGAWMVRGPDGPYGQIQGTKIECEGGVHHVRRMNSLASGRYAAELVVRPR